MKQINSSFLSCVNLAVTNKFQNTGVLCLVFLLVMKKFVPPENNSNYGNSNKKRK